MEPPGGELRPASTPPAASPAGVRRFDDAVRDILQAALAAAGGKVYGPDGAAALLGLKPTTLQSKLQKYGVRAPAVS
ncbi:MAG: hypothetical protein HY906_18570 [Deltaproteobacteria bacterium]|nr:hypothetical protein [Deltaproteobacteria bacterium]